MIPVLPHSPSTFSKDVIHFGQIIEAVTVYDTDDVYEISEESLVTKPSDLLETKCITPNKTFYLVDIAYV